ncbi:hypothetical protein K8640_14990 [Myxococcus sp. XM-1-1-1]|uniref:hypothetical protein n=1 Tax=Myxococcus sp. XM-1-1-1 TaxID=2874602 RepID=UPI001CBBE296|nr:hypothetical protein [Myxococcus sp. XM-1-1-1]MBZ4409528.1 hypothetical protein [Myxococcus sp. XM-1-1-1]
MLKVSAVSWGEFRPEENKSLPPSYQVDPRLTVRQGDLLISRANTVQLVGAVVIVDKDYPRLMLSDKTLRLVPASADVSRRFLLHALRMNWVREVFEEDATGTSDSMRNLSQEKIRSAPIALAPAPEQRRIVAKLEALLARSRRAKEALDAIPALLERFRQSVLAAAFRGDLTQDWRAANPNVEPASKLLERIRTERRHLWEITELERMQTKGKEPRDDCWKERYDAPASLASTEREELPAGWEWATIEELTTGARRIAYGVLKPGEHVRDGVRLIKSGQVRNGFMSLEDDFRISRSLDEEFRKTRLSGGEVLLNLVGASIGRSAVAPAELRGANVSRAIAVLPIISGLETWVQRALEGPAGQRLMATATGGSAQPVLNLAEVRPLPVPFPPEQERREIERRVDSAFTSLSRVFTAWAAGHRQLEGLEPQILAKAFRGELVPQDPTDEPASVLLDKIRAVRSKHEQHPKPLKRLRTPRLA